VSPDGHSDVAPADHDPLAAWRAAGARMIGENFTAFRELVDDARRLAAAKRYDEAAARATMAAYHAQRRHAGLFRSPELERVLRSIGHETCPPEPRARPRTGRIDRVLHIGTNMSVMSGNPRLIRRWIRQDSTRASSLGLTKQAPDLVPRHLRETVLSSRGRIHRLNSGFGGFVARARRLRALASEADVVVHHCWENDVVPTIAFAHGEGLPPILFVNHGDHWFWPGASFADVVVNLRESGMRLSQERRGIEPRRNELLPTPLELQRRVLSRPDAKRRLGVDPDTVLLLSIAGAAKYRTVDGVDFAAAHVPILRAHPHASLIVIGPLGIEDWSAARGAVDGRIRVLGETFDTALYYQAADIYVDSFPFTSITSLLEAGSHGTPVVTRSPFPERAAVLGSDAPGLTGSMERASNPEQYASILSRLIADRDARESLGEKTRARIEEAHWGEGWKRRLENVYRHAASLPQIERIDTTPADEMVIDDPDVYLPVIHGHTWYQDWIAQYVVRSVPLAARWRYWRTWLRARHGTRSALTMLVPEWLFVQGTRVEKVLVWMGHRVVRGVRARRRAIAFGVAGLGIAVAATLGGVAWHYSNRIIGPRAPSTLHEQHVWSAGPGRIRLSRDRESQQAGTWALEWERGFGWLGPVLESDSGSVVREFRSVVSRPPADGWASVRGVPKSADPRTMLGLAFDTVAYSGPLGSYPAWFVPGRDSTWVIYVHGLAATRAEGLRTLSVLAPRGLPGLFVTYRNDVGAPPSADGLYHLGATEWEDLEAAVRYALAHGARRLVLTGYSMGGQIVMQFMSRSPLARHVTAVLLESPVLDWDATLDYRARVLKVPAMATWLGKGVAAARARFDWGQLDRVAHSRGISTPILMFQNVHDQFTPPSRSEAFARALPGVVTLNRIEAGNHVEAWNPDPARYAAILNAWFTAHRIGRTPA
jgi:glycosyltransferase involved in cell wall biosynthesis